MCTICRDSPDVTPLGTADSLDGILAHIEKDAGPHGTGKYRLDVDGDAGKKLWGTVSKENDGTFIVAPIREG
jgi:hypothetical protein